MMGASTDSIKIWIATSNPNKLREYKLLCDGLPIEIHAAGELKFFEFPPENGKTFEDNARIKARSLSAVLPGEWVLGEDSGLCVDALGGIPGVHSARYAGDRASDAENCAKLLKMMQIRAGTNRKAYFQSTLICYSPDGKETVYEGRLEGAIISQARGTKGFGYDPVFTPSGHNQTVAELEPSVKNEISHRSQAFRKWLHYFEKYRGSGASQNFGQ